MNTNDNNADAGEGNGDDEHNICNNNNNDKRITMSFKLSIQFTCIDMFYMS